MLKEGYISLVKAHHYMPVIFEAMHHDEDPIVQSCLALMIGLLLQDPDGCKEIVAIEGMVQFLCQSMEVDMDFMALMPSARQEVALFNDFKDLVRQSGILRKGQKVLVKSLILSSTARIIEECVTLEDIRVLLIVEQDPQFLSFVIQSLIEDLAWIKEPSSTPGVSLSDVLDIGRIESSLRILERLAMVSSRPAAALANNNNRIFSLLVHLITLCRMHAFQYPHQTESLNIMLHVLRLLINVTNGNEPCCEGLSQGGSIPVLVQNFVQFYGRSRNYRPGESLLEQRQQELPTEARLQGKDSRRRRGQRGERTGEPSSTKLRRSSSNHPAFQEEEDTLSSADSGSEGEYQDDKITIDNNADGWYDLLLLSLGLLINMLESAPLRRKQLTETGGNADDEARLYKSVHGQSLAPMLELLKGFVALHQAIQLDSPDQQQSSQELLKSSSCLSTEGTLALSDSFIPPTLDSDSEANDNLQAAEIVFVNSAKRAAETQANFLKIIHLLQDMESRQVSRSK
ncbi:hypothetical protein KVV02_005600 [Mortierella alpina]|uniref:Wings apart-like protein C-terminal domain-containing protein n=1 Tax=Mortierella alpina TaxID=64518 RepID=A0A9P7ZWB9_MORAP|nr:hypothetical protein KVV02_005600 [Mortierella alpina]